MDVLILNHREVRALLPMNECISAMENVFITLAKGDALQPLRWPMFLPDRSGLLGMMPGYIGGDINLMGIKTVLGLCRGTTAQSMTPIRGRLCSSRKSMAS